MAVTKPEEVAEILVRKLREDNALRHQLDIEGAVEAIADTDGAPTDVVAYSDSEGNSVFLKVEFA